MAMIERSTTNLSLAVRADGSIDPDTSAGRKLMNELRAFYDEWDSSEQVERAPLPCWRVLREQAESGGLTDVAAVIPALMRAMGDASEELQPRTDIVRWVRAHLLVAKDPRYGTVEAIAHRLDLLGAQHVDAIREEEERALLQRYPEPQDWRGHELGAGGTADAGRTEAALDPDPDVSY
jgi:hypothetical protein